MSEQRATARGVVVGILACVLGVGATWAETREQSERPPRDPAVDINLSITEDPDPTRIAVSFGSGARPWMQPARGRQPGTRPAAAVPGSPPQHVPRPGAHGCPGMPTVLDRLMRRAFTLWFDIALSDPHCGGD